MDEKDLNRYINKNFEKWLQYSKFICNKVGIANEAEDVIQEVICMLFEKKGVKGLLELIEKKTEDGSELDYYVLNVIKGNCMLPNAPYMWRYHKDPCTGNWDMIQPEQIMYNPFEEDIEQVEKTFQKKICDDNIHFRQHEYIKRESRYILFSLC